MKKLLLFTFVLFITITIKAQMFATPNSQWYYNRTALIGPSYSQITLGGTVTVASKICTQLNYYSQTYNYPSGPITTNSTIPYRYIYENNKVVFLHNPNTNNFDTLYNYNAVIGSKWLLPAIYTNTFFAPCNRTTITVIDTGHTTIQGEYLKWLKTNVDTIYERIGFLNQYFFQYDNCTSPYDYNEGGSLRCFNDNQIINYNRTSNLCNYLYSTTSINKNINNINFKIYPNPFSSNLTLNYYNPITTDKKKIIIISPFGQIFYQTEFYQNIITLDLSAIPGGAYIVQLYLNDEFNFRTKLIKQ